jgi:tellurite resistance protein
MPVSFFSMAVGTLAWGQSWQAAALVWSVPAWAVTLASALGVVVWLVLLAAYAHKTWAQPQTVRDEFNHPVQSALTALLPVSSLLAAITLKPWLPEWAHGLLVLALLAQLLLGLWLTGRFWQGGRAPDEGLWLLLAPVLFGVANAVFALLVWQTARLFFQGRLLPKLPEEKV